MRERPLRTRRAPLDERAGVLAGLEQEIAETVGTILASTPMSRFEIAARMSELLGEPISKLMLDAYASRARTDHKMPMSRFFALVLATKRHDLFDPLVRRIGAGLPSSGPRPLAKAR